VIEQLAKLPGPFDRPDLGPLIVSEKDRSQNGTGVGPELLPFASKRMIRIVAR